MRRNASRPAAGQRHMRCAIYTRKSTEEGLDQEFNSLDAQREACAAYVMSQRHEGWTLIPGSYDDGGFSGGSMERPGLQRLLDDVRAGRVDVIVVYKVDRLTRSLADFARIVEILERAGASFVSVTQAFNTTSSMGRLTLNVLLSFAQFEREVIAERVRDKIAASKAKGMWMGGVVPLGYDVQDRKLVPNDKEAETVSHIMRRYLALGSVRALQYDLQADGVCNKNGNAFVRGPLFHLLKNRIYVGEICHRDRVYPGEQPPIVDRELFDRVQALLASNAADRKSGNSAAHPSLLAGMIRDEGDRPMSPSHANKQGQRYRYYVSNEAVPTDHSNPIRTIRLPAPEIEKAVVDAVCALFAQAETVRALWTQLSATMVERAEARCREIASRLRDADLVGRRTLLQQIDLQIAVSEHVVEASCSHASLLKLIGVDVDIDERERIPITIATRLRRRGQELRLVVEPADGVRRNAQLIGLIVKAHEARRQLIDDVISSDGERHALTRIARLSYLSPEITTAILDGRQPSDMAPRRLLRVADLPLCWSEQRRMLGFASNPI